MCLQYFTFLRAPHKRLSFHIKLHCHGRGREFESRRPRHIFKHLHETQKKSGSFWVQQAFEALRPPRILPNQFKNARSDTIAPAQSGAFFCVTFPVRVSSLLQFVTGVYWASVIPD
jgi:hypothetical protein